MSKKLLQFEASEKGVNKEFVFYGNCEKKCLDVWGRPFDTICVDEEDLRLVQIVDGREVPYEVKGTTWTGMPYDEEDAFEQTWTALTQEEVIDVPYHFSYVDADIQSVVDYYKKEKVEDQNGQLIQRYFIYRDPEAVYEISAATKSELYYLNLQDEGTVNIGRSDKCVYSDNHFAEGAYFKLLYDDNPKEPIVYLRESDAEIVREEKNRNH